MKTAAEIARDVLRVSGTTERFYPTEPHYGTAGYVKLAASIEAAIAQERARVTTVVAEEVAIERGACAAWVAANLSDNWAGRLVDARDAAIRARGGK